MEALEQEGLGSGSPGGDVLEADRQATILRTLLDQGDLGAAFKVMVQVREAG